MLITNLNTQWLILGINRHFGLGLVGVWVWVLGLDPDPNRIKINLGLVSEFFWSSSFDEIEAMKNN